VALWDLLLLPWVAAPDAARQGQVADWLAARLGVREAFAPERLSRVVEAFERQLDTERQANDLDYDASGRLNFSATEMADEIGNAKGDASALRMHYNRRRRYGESHIAARVEQLDALLLRIAGYTQEVGEHGASLHAYAAGSLWLDPDLTQRAASNLERTASSVQLLAERARALRAGFLELPRLPQDDGALPEPVDCEPLDAA
jgi:MoxR-like ATPase